MSKPDAASGSLESILASIRKSLSEQSVEGSSEEKAVPAEQAKDAGSRKGGLTRRLAGTGSEAASPSASKVAADDLADLLEEPVTLPSIAKPAAGAAAPMVSAAVPAPAPAAAASAAAASPPEEDPLWFLTRREEPAPAEAAPATEPVLTRPEVVRATMPPFFGSTSEVAKQDASENDAGRAPARPAQAASSPTVTPAAAAHAPLLQTGLGDRGAGAVKAGLQPPAGQALANGRGAEPGEAKGAAQGDTQYTRALESAVLDLLKPMLAQWLDRNMPRLVAEALKDEASRARAAAEGAKKA